MIEYMSSDTSLKFKWLMETRLLTSCFGTKTALI